MQAHSASLNCIGDGRNVTFDTSPSTLERIQRNFVYSCLNRDKLAHHAVQTLYTVRPLRNAMDKKEIESPKLTANFLVWIGLFLVLMFLLTHYVLKFL